jgi:uncharacterized protein
VLIAVEESAAEAEQRLIATMRELGSVLVALSGGVDSAVVASAARKALGDRAVALTACSPTLPASEAAEAARVAGVIGIRHVLVDTNELEREGYRANQGDRCYFCKTELFDAAEGLRSRLGLDWVADGTIPSDFSDVRPGLRAARENRVRHPLVEARVDKPEVRAIARANGLPVWDKPSLACLGSRFPAGTRISVEKLERVAAAEAVLRELGLRRCRVRWHEIGGDVLARIEVDPADLSLLVQEPARRELVEAVRAAGFRWVTLDLAGYASPTGVG